MIRHRLAILLLAACGADAGAPCPGTCVADPDPHCVARDACTRDSECPAGLACRPEAVDSVCADEADRALTCRPYPPEASHAFALREGFAAKQLHLELSEGPPAALAWTAGRDAVFVSCAIFKCPPVFAATGLQTLDGRHGLELIYNFASCALVHRVAPADEGSFVLARTAQDREIVAPLAVCDADEPPLRERAAAVQLLAGCWAYDLTRVVSASNLVTLRPDQVTGLDLPEAACSQASGAECQLHDSSFGTCLDGTCRPRCLTAVDCEVASGAEPDAGVHACAWECVPDVGSALGACRPRG